MHLVLVVPWSRAAAYLATVRFLSLFYEGSAAARDGLGGRLEQQVRRRRAGILVAGAALAEVARAALARHQRHPRRARTAGARRRRGRGGAPPRPGRGRPATSSPSAARRASSAGPSASSIVL